MMIKKVAKILLKLFQTLLLKLWIQSLENILRVTTLDYRSRYRSLNPILVWFKDMGWLLMTLGRVNVIRLEGSEWTVTSIVDDYTHSEKELASVLFTETPRTSQVDRRFVWEIPRLTPELLAQSDLVVCEFNRHIRWHPKQATYVFRSPPWLRMGMNIDDTMDTIMAQMCRGRRRSLAKMQEQGFTYEFSQNPDDLELFYYDMYLPYISSRHLDRAIIEPFETKQTMFQKGGLLIVKLQNEPVAAVLGYIVGNSFVAGSMGVHKNHFELVKKGAILALYWSIIEWARQQKLEYIDFGLTRARIYDPSFWAKMLWGMSIQPNLLDDHTYWLFATDTLPDSLKEFLNEAGFIAEIDGTYQYVVWAEENTRPAGQELKDLKKMARQAGLEGVLILPTKQPTRTTASNLSLKYIRHGVTLH